MRQKLEFPQYDSPEAPDKLSASTGLGALAAEQTVLESEHEYENALKDAEFLDRYNDRNRFLTRAPRKREVLGWVKGKYGPYSDTERGASLAHNRVRGAEGQVGADKQTLRHYINSVRKNIERLDDYEADRLGEGIEFTLDEYAARHNLDANALAFRQWKQRAEEQAGQPMTWAEWITRPGAPSGEEIDEKDRQVLNLLHLNQTVFDERNNDPAQKDRLQELDSSYHSGLSTAVKGRMLSSKLLNAYTVKRPRVIVGEPLDEILLSANGFIDPADDIILAPNFKDGTYVHERTHLLGEFGDNFWNEGGTQLIADMIDIARGADMHDTPTYKPNLLSVFNLMQASNVDMHEMSEYFANDDLVGFFDKVKQETGEDVFEAYIKIRAAAQLHKDEYEQKQQLKRDVLEYTRSVKDKVASRNQP